MPILHSVVTKKDYEIPDAVYWQTKKEYNEMVKQAFHNAPPAPPSVPFNELAFARYGNHYYLFELGDAIAIQKKVETFFEERGIPCI